MTTERESRADRDPGLLFFWVAQPVVLALLVWMAVTAAGEFGRPWQMPPLRDEPLSVRPLYDFDDMITDEQLRRFLLRLRPRLEGDQTLLPNVDHALRLWGADADFGDPQFASSDQLRGLLTDHRQFAALYGAHQPPLLIHEGDGIRFRLQEGLATCSHPDHTSACLAEVGTRLSFPIVGPESTTTFRAAVEQAMRDLRLKQVEYEWSVKMCALFLPPTRRWQTTDGQQMSFDRLADRMMWELLPRGVCWANHRLYGLAALLQIDQQVPILSPTTRQRIYLFLLDATDRLVLTQHTDGFWNDQWSFAKPETSEPTERDGDQLGDRILVTGHTLEWWAIAPQELHPPRRALVAAAQWLVRTLDTMSDDQVQQNYAFLSHAGRALAEWRSREPFDVIRETKP
jgi:hypothetical protein